MSHGSSGPTALAPQDQWVSVPQRQWHASEGRVMGWGGAALSSGSDGRAHATCCLPRSAMYFEVITVSDDTDIELVVGFGDAAYTPELTGATSRCVGCGVDPNGRPFYTVDGEIVHVDHKRLLLDSLAVVTLLRSTPGSVLLLNVGQHPWRYAPAAASTEHPGDLVAVSQKTVRLAHRSSLHPVV